MSIFKIFGKLDFKEHKRVFWLALIYTLLFNSSVLWHKFQYIQSNLGIALVEISKDATLAFSMCFVIFFALSVHRFLLNFMSVVFYISGAIASYTLFYFKIPSTPQLIRSFFENELNETAAAISVVIVFWVVGSALISIYILYRYRHEKNDNKLLLLLKFICLAASLAIFINPKTKFFNTYYPSKYTHSTYKFVKEKYIVKYDKVDIASKYNFSLNSNDDVIGILIVGEAARYDHFSLNGYKRNTNQNLAKLPNLVSFKAKATANYTYLSVPSMLARSCYREEDINKETTLLSVLTKLGIHTSWIGTQTLMKYLRGHNTETLYDETNITIIPGGSALYMPNEHDEVMFPYIFDLLQKEARQFMVIHTSGSHWNYASRHPDKYTYFKPALMASKGTFVDPPNCDREKLINSYDNSIIYADYIISEIIDRVKDKNAFVLYVSDHGESLGEDGFFAHGSEYRKEQYEIPFLFWASDKFLAGNKDLLANLKKQQKKILTHQHVFHSILDCFAIKSDIIDPKMSLCAKPNR